MNAFLLALNYAVVGLIVSLCLAKRRFKLLDPAWAFIVGYFINYCVRPTLFLISPELGSAYGGMFNNDTIMRGFNGALVFAIVGLFGFAMGNLAFPNCSEKLALALPSPHLNDILKTRAVRWLALLFLAAGWWGLRSFLAQVGWVGSFLLLLQGGERNQFSEATFGHGGFTFAAQLSLVGWALICAHWIATPAPSGWERRALRRIVQFFWFVLTLCIWAAFGERSSLMAVLFVPLALRYTLPRQASNREVRTSVIPVKKLVLTLTVLAFLVGGPLGLLFKQTEASTSAAISMSISAWDSFEFTVLAQNQLKLRDLRWGSTYFQDVAYSWVPRELFPSKPERYGIVLIQDDLAPELEANVGATFPPGMLVEAFANFGYLGLFLVPLLVGIFCRVIYVRFEQGDAFLIVLLSFLFSTLASFRSFGGFLSLLLANALVLWIVITVCSAIESGRWMIKRLHLERAPQA